MVQPVSTAPANGRPECSSGRPALKPITTRNSDAFSARLRHSGERAPGSAAAEPKAVTRSADGAHPEREMSPEPELPRSLAPEEQPSFGQAGVELAEWFSLINPSGAVDAPRPVESAVLPSPVGVVEVAELVERWVRRVALGGDQRRGAVRLDFGHGRLSGAELVVVADAGRVSVELCLPPAMVAPELSERLRARLERRGFIADVVVR